jgi:recombination protein RecA
MAKPGQTIKGVSVSAMMQAAKDEMGEDIGQIGGEYLDCERIPTGLLEFDVATGGGFPRRKVSIVHGNESSCKTVHAALAIASHQRMYPELVCAYIALEGFGQNEKAWFEALGVDVEKLAVFWPTYAEQVVDLVDSLCWASDVGLVVLDSIAAMMNVTEFENSAEKKSMGGVSIPISVMVRKVNTALNKAPSMPTLIYINQNRTKIGVMYGDPTTMPGGNAIKYQSSLTVRLYGKNEMDTKVSKVMPVRKAVTANITKWKVPILSVKAEYEAVMIPYKGLRVGQTDWFNTFKQYAQALGMLKKNEKKGWDCYDQTWDTLDALKQELYSDPKLCAAVTQDLIAALANDGSLIAAQEGDDE